MTCGKPIAQHWDNYINMTKKGTKPASALDKLGIERFCCRSVFLANVGMTKRVGQFMK